MLRKKPIVQPPSARIGAGPAGGSATAGPCGGRLDANCDGVTRSRYSPPSTTPWPLVGASAASGGSP